MGTSCRLKKKCYVCQKELHNLEFHSNAKGRIDIKPYCKHCKAIYEGIKKGLLSEEVYIGLNYNVSELKGDCHGNIMFLHHNNHVENVTLDKAVRLVKQGGAYLTSHCTIKSLTFIETKGLNLRNHILKRDNYSCFYSGKYGDTIDHVIPRSRGGLDTPLNLVCSSENMNRLKSNLSLNPFLKRLKSGYYDEQSPLQLTLEKCRCCHNVFRINQFLSNGTMTCDKCTKFQNALLLGFISVDDLKKININYSFLDTSDSPCEFLDINGELIGSINPHKAKKILKHGVATISNKKQIRLILTYEQLKQIYPHFFIDINLDGKNKKKAINSKNKSIKLKRISRIAFFGRNGKRLESGSVPYELANQFVQDGFANVVKKNRIQLTISLYDLLKKYPEKKQYLLKKSKKDTLSDATKETLVQSKKNERVETKRISLKDIHSIDICKINKINADELVKLKIANRINNETIKLNYSIKESINKYPTFAFLGVFTNKFYCLDKISLIDQHGFKFTDLNRIDVFKLVRENYLFPVTPYKVQFFIPFEKLKELLFKEKNIKIA